MLRRLPVFIRRLRSHPAEALDHLAGALETRWEAVTLPAADYTIVGWDQAIDGLEAASGLAIRPYLGEPPLREIRAAVSERVAALGEAGPFPPVYNADVGLSELCYALVRAFRPEVVVVTGVAYGLAIAYLLAAQKVNGCGVVHAIDLPPLAEGAGRATGALIPDELRDRLSLHRGASKRILPWLLSRLDGVDFFLHDSLHTCHNIQRELDAIAPRLRRPGIVVVDDSNQNPALNVWLRRRPPTFSAVLQENDKDTMCGVSLFMPGE
jgi:SAM-dependent methyltransferase